MSMGPTINRRRFMGAAAGAAGAAALGSRSPAVAAARGGGHGDDEGGDGHGGVVSRDRIGVQQWSIRDAITRQDGSVQGYLGGRDFPYDPTDLGPLVTLPGGFASVFRYLASVGYRGFEFFSFDQGPNGAITNEQLRAALARAGLVAAGTHTGGLQSMIDPAYRQTEIERARVLGHRMIGTAGNPGPGSPPSGLLADWQRWAQQANQVGAALRAAGLKYFFHPEQDWFRFFDDPSHPELSRVHRIDWFTDNTDPRLVFFEPDTIPRPRRRHALRRQPLVRPPRRAAAADRVAHQGRRPDPGPRGGHEPVLARARPTALPAQRWHRRRLRGRGLDRQGIPL
jgi:hypothetical protein